jgi:hypothetical protein
MAMASRQAAHRREETFGPLTRHYYHRDTKRGPQLYYAERKALYTTASKGRDELIKDLRIALVKAARKGVYDTRPIGVYVPLPDTYGFEDYSSTYGGALAALHAREWLDSANGQAATAAAFPGARAVVEPDADEGQFINVYMIGAAEKGAALELDAKDSEFLRCVVRDAVRRARRLGQVESVLDLPTRDASLEDVYAAMRKADLPDCSAEIYPPDFWGKRLIRLSWRDGNAPRQDPLEWSDEDAEELTAEEKAKATKRNEYAVDVDERFQRCKRKKVTTVAQSDSGGDDEPEE